jgi:PD-(D/E)XK nuclease superfamily
VTAADAEGDPACVPAESDKLLAAHPGDHAVPVAWEQSMASMRREVDALRSDGRWRGGRRTLMHALGIHYREVYLTAGLAWLLDPDGWHGLGSQVLQGLLVQLGLPATAGYPVIVTTEEARPAWQTRADLVVRMPGTTLLFEAKVYSGEEPEQCDRLARAWEPEIPTLVFLTGDGRLPLTAIHSAGQWQLLTWSRVGTVIRASIAKTPDCAPGARELLTTIETFGK